MSVASTYEAALKRRGYSPDPAQQRAVPVLEHCAAQWVRYDSRCAGLLSKLRLKPSMPQGVYLFGGVGRGKSFLMDCFFEALPLERKTRLHFHEFMAEVHQELARLQGQVNPLDELARRMARRYRVICFDEFHIADISDAMILYRLLSALFAAGVGLVMTSNAHPDELYPDGLHRQLILPAIELLKKNLHVFNVDHPRDYRQGVSAVQDLYHCPLGAQAHEAMQRDFVRLSQGQAAIDPVLLIRARPIVAERRAAGIVWFDFHTLCAGPRSQDDYLQIASEHHTVLLSNVPQMQPEHASQARRLSWLVDVLYDRRVQLVISAAVPPEQLYRQGALSHEFARTVSRLVELRRAPFARQHQRQVDTRLTAP